MFLRPLLLLAFGLAASSCSTAQVARPDSWRAYGSLVQVEVIDRATGRALPVYWHGGKRWVAGNPGSRYALRIHNPSYGRVLAVISVDGVNAVTGETAAWDQVGYVFDSRRSAQITGWRKSQDRVAAFEFTTLQDSYAARTGRPDHVGVIGVAVFRERVRAERVPLAPPPISGEPRPSEGATGRSEGAAGPQAPAADARAARRDAPMSATAPSERLGTGHGRSEASRVTYTDFERARLAPDEIVTIHYDSPENLMAMGVIPRWRPAPHPEPDPFPGPPGFVPDPPQ
jgi:hypothetical protein